MTRFTTAVLLCLVLVPGAGNAQTVPGFNSLQFKVEQVGEGHIRLIGAVEIDSGDGEWQFYADEVDYFTDDHRLIANGNVVFTSGPSHVAADSVEFDTQTRTGTFRHATGTVTLGDRADRSMFGGQEPDMYFYGETLEILGSRRYRLTNGAFTTCVQPTPRWEMVSSSFELNLDDYAILKHSVLRVKGVPVFYMPVFYYPIQEDDRATGFLVPTYGASSIRGQAISNAFFWAITRSQDATFFHDWFSTTGQGAGTEYRYVLGPGSEGRARTYFLSQHATTGVTSSGGTTRETLIPGSRSYEIRGSATQALGSALRARGQVDYFSDVTVQQTYHANIFDASRRQRSFGGNVTGSWGAYMLSGTFDWNETFFGESQSTLHGGAPRVSFSRAERPFRNWPIYLSVGGEYAQLLRRRLSPGRRVESGLARADVNPLVRVPFARWPFLTVNSSLGWRATYWSESRDEDTRAQVDAGITRRFFDLQSQITGPVFVRIWDTPNNRYAERLKHVIEPFVTLQRITAIDNFDQIVQLEGIDSILGSTTRVSYGVNNRVYAKRSEGGAAAVAREIINVAITQSYYTDARAAQFDRQFRTSFNRTPPSHFSPVSLVVRASPTNDINGTLRADYDTQFGAFRTIGADGTVAIGPWVRTTAGWSQRRFVEGLRGFDDRSRLDHFLNASTTVRSRANRVGGSYAFNYDLLGDRFLQQRIVAYYNAQCCGVAVEYQTFNFQGLGARARVPRDRRFNLSFTLAGLGTFSNFFGALGGQPGT